MNIKGKCLLSNNTISIMKTAPGSTSKISNLSMKNGRTKSETLSTKNSNFSTISHTPAPKAQKKATMKIFLQLAIFYSIFLSSIPTPKSIIFEYRPEKRRKKKKEKNRRKKRKPKSNLKA